MRKTSFLFKYVAVWRPVCGFLLSERTRAFHLFSFVLCICWTFLSSFCLSERYLGFSKLKKANKKLGWCVNKFNQLFSRKNASVTGYYIIQQTIYKNVVNVFLARYKEKIWSPVILACVWGKLWQVNRLIIAMSSFSKSSVFKMFPVHAH